MRRRSSWHRTSNVLDNLRHDLKHDARRLVRSPAFTLVSVLSLAFGIAGATAFFSVVNATLFRPAPHVQRPEELVAIYADSQPTLYLLPSRVLPIENTHHDPRPITGGMPFEFAALLRRFRAE